MERSGVTEALAELVGLDTKNSGLWEGSRDAKQYLAQDNGFKQRTYFRYPVGSENQSGVEFPGRIQLSEIPRLFLKAICAEQNMPGNSISTPRFDLISQIGGLAGQVYQGDYRWNQL